MSTFDPAKLLRKIFFLKDIDYVLNELAGKMSVERFEKGESIFQEGVEGTRMYLIFSGKVLIYSVSANGQEIPIQILEAHEIFGEMCLLDGGKRSASAKATEDSVLFCLERKDFLDFLMRNPLASLKIIETLGKRLRQVNTQLKFLTENNRRISRTPSQVSTSNVNVPENKMLEPGKKENNLDSPKISFLGSSTKSDPEFTEQKRQELENMLFYSKATCPLCSAKFETPRVRSNYIRVKSIDKDFCNHYESINPLYYEIIVCPKCCFAFDLDISKVNFAPAQREKINSRLQQIQVETINRFFGVRTLEDAIAAFQLALYALENGALKNSKMGMLNLKTAWLYRFKGNEADERKYLDKAVTYFTLAYEKEGFTDQKSELNITYLLGALYFKIGNYQEAAKWLNMVMKHPARSMVPIVTNQAKELWSEVRQKLREEKQQ